MFEFSYKGIFTILSKINELASPKNSLNNHG